MVWKKNLFLPKRGSITGDNQRLPQELRYALSSIGERMVIQREWGDSGRVSK
jgi:hypothetical protein